MLSITNVKGVFFKKDMFNFNNQWKVDSPIPILKI